MYNLKGFINIPKFINNTPIMGNDTVPGISPIGEMSKWSMTFSKNIGEYKNNIYPDVYLIAMHSKDSLLGNVQCPDEYVSTVLKVSQWLINYTNAINRQADKLTLSNDISSVFAGDITNVIIGDMLSVNLLGTNQNFPEWVSWVNNKTGAIIKIWFNDVAFSEQYDEFEIVVIPPIKTSSLDDFFLIPSLIAKEVADVTATEWMDKVQEAKQKNPETFVRTETYSYLNVLYPGVTFKTNWTFLIYGIAGDNPDALKQALIDFILSHSTHSQDDWGKILPDIFKRTEFVIIPKWNDLAIPNKTVQLGIYSPFINHKNTLNLFKMILPDYDPLHIEKYLTSFGHPYKSIALASVGSKDNRNSSFLLTDYYPDYINVSTGSLDFNRMNVATKDFILLLEYMLIVGEKLTDFDSINNNILVGFTGAKPVLHKVIRNNKLFVSCVYNNLHILLSVKNNNFF